jgi:pimeloyl-ACP methyl ester carboxylesterase
MEAKEHFIDNNGVTIHCLEYNGTASGTPLIVIPGMINSAEEVAESIGIFLTRRTIIISLRGRGKSSSPSVGWKLGDQASDIAAVVHHFAFKEIDLFGHSTGGSIAARSLPMLSAEVSGFIIGDYAPFYPPMDSRWGDRVLTLQDRQISDVAVEGIVAEAEYTDVSSYLDKVKSRLFVITGEPDKSMLRATSIAKLREVFPLLRVEVLEGCGHEFLSDDPQCSVEAIERLLQAQ